MKRMKEDERGWKRMEEDERGHRCYTLYIIYRGDIYQKNDLDGK